MPHLSAICALLLLASSPLLAAGPTLVVKLPGNSDIKSAVASATSLKLQTQGTISGRTITFANLLPETSYDLKISLADGTTLQTADMSWYSPEPAKADAAALDDDDRKGIKEIFDGIQAFENKRNLLAISGNHDRATILAELIRDSAFHSAKGDEVIWRVELWYFRNQHGGWEKAQANKVLRRERFKNRQDYLKETEKLVWIPLPEGIRLTKTQATREIILPRP